MYIKLLQLVILSIPGVPPQNFYRLPINISYVIPTPIVTSGVQNLASNVNILQISGIGLKGASRLSLYFNPPLFWQVAYEFEEQFPLQSDTIRLRLRYGYSWRSSDGPLFLVGIDTGAGPVRIGDQQSGVLIANVHMRDIAAPLLMVNASFQVCLYILLYKPV